MEKLNFKLAVVVGTRPEIIRLSRVLDLANSMVNLVLIHTGQNYDYELNQIFFDELGVKRPDYFLNADVSSLGSTVGDILKKVEPILKEERPDAFLVLGDTNSCLSAYIAKRLKIPVFHMEAGNRCFDFNVPEETNRRIIDHIADFNLVYTEHARRHLIAEGLPQRRIYLTGSPMKEVLNAYAEKVNQSSILAELKLTPKNYFVFSIHREENVDYPDQLQKIVESIHALSSAYPIPFVFSVHPRTLRRIEAMELNLPSNVMLLKPFGFFDYIALQKHAKCVISDSGTISEESSMLSFPAISIRESMERPEAQDVGTIILSGIKKEGVLNAVRMVIEEFERNSHYSEIAPDYQIDNTSWRVMKLIVGNAALNAKWNNLL
jgi:UDP-N-acetylglucosamine 2-epimerase (non-hydrolysing)